MRAPHSLPPRRALRGFNLIELLVGVAVMGVLLTVGLPNLSTWIQNAQIRTASEGLAAGLQLARAEALRRNASVRFQLTTTLDSSCALATSGKNWIVSLADPTGACGTPPSDTAAPQIIQAKASAEGTSNAVLSATGGSSVVFNGLGRVTGTGMTRIDVSNAAGGACVGTDGVGGGPMRCMRLQISTGGEVRMCDPAVSDTTDPRYCP